MKKIIKENLSYIILLIIIILLRVYVFSFIRVQGSSMDTTLKNGEIMFMTKLRRPAKESIVVISKKVEGTPIIKRVIAMPGQTIRCTDGIIYIDEEKYDDSHAYGITSDFDLIRLKDDEYFVLGDNRLVSKDSRYFGPVKKDNILGTTDFILLPFNKIGKVS